MNDLNRPIDEDLMQRLKRCEALATKGNAHAFLAELPTLVSIPAVCYYLDGGIPFEHSRCFAHVGRSPTVMHIFEKDNTEYSSSMDNYFYCSDSECKAGPNRTHTQGDVTCYYMLRVNLRQHTFNTQWQAGVDLVQKALAGKINLNIKRCSNRTSKSLPKHQVTPDSQSGSEGALPLNIREKLKILLMIGKDLHVLKEAKKYKEPAREDLLWIPPNDIVKVLIREHPIDSSYVRFSMKVVFDGGKAFLVRDWLANERYQRNCYKWAYVWPTCFSGLKADRPSALPSRYIVLEKDEKVVDDRGNDIDPAVWMPEKEKQPRLYHWLATQKIARESGITLEEIHDSCFRSYHSVWDRHDSTDEQVFDFFKVARLLGIDPVTIMPELRVRMPNGTRHEIKMANTTKEVSLRQTVIWMSERFKWFCNNTK